MGTPLLREFLSQFFFTFFLWQNPFKKAKLLSPAVEKWILLFERTIPSSVYLFNVLLRLVIFFPSSLFLSTLSDHGTALKQYNAFAGHRPSLEAVERLQTPGLEELVDLMKKCWDQDPQKRPHFSSEKTVLQQTPLNPIVL